MATENKIFAVFAASSPDKLAPTIASTFPDAHLSVGVGQWLLIGPSTMTTQELSAKLGLVEPEAASNAIIVSVSSYFGRAPLNVWEWLAAKMGGNNAATGT